MIYSVSFEYLCDGEWRWSVDHRIECKDADTAIRVWGRKGYGSPKRGTQRNVTAVPVLDFGVL